MTITVIIGAPCAGKSTYAREHKRDGDVVVDYDELAKALGSITPHESSGAIRLVALAVRREAIQKILGGIDTDAFIIHTNPPQEIAEQYIEAGAKFVLLDPSRETCLKRAEQRPAHTIEGIEKWYESPPNIISRLGLAPLKSESAKILAALELRELAQALSNRF